MSNNKTAIATGILCSEYKHETDQFIFISKNSDIGSSEDYHLNIYNYSNKTMLSPVPLLKIAHFPNATNLHFGGLCSYADSRSSFYLNFEETSTTNSTDTTTLIYQLQLDNTTSLPQQFQKTPVEIFNSTLSSFAYAASSIANATSNLAYISTSTTTHQTSLNLVNLDHPQQQTTKNTSSDLGLLAVGGTGSQSLYFIQNHAVDVYRLDTLQYSHTTLHTNITLEGLKRGTTGHVFSASDKDYISFYHSNSGQMDIFDINPSLVKYTSASVSKDGYIDLTKTGAPAPTIKQSSNASHLLSMIKEKERHKRDMKPSRRSLLKAFSDKFYLKSKCDLSCRRSNTNMCFTGGAANRVLRRRAIDTSNDNMQTSSDGAINYHTSRVVPNNGEGLPQAAILVPAASSSNNALYDYVVLSEDGANPNQFSVTTESTTRSQIPVIQTPTDNAILEDASAASHLGGGAIAGIVVSVIAFIAIIAGLLFYSKKRKDRVYASSINRSIKPAMTTFNSGTPLSIQPDDFVGARYSGGAGGSGIGIHQIDDNHTNTSSILQATTFIPEEYHDGSRPDIRPLSYSDETIDYAQLSSEELSQLEPDVQGPLFLFSGVYTSSAEERVTYLQDGYAIRTFEAKDGLKHTVHYFSAAHLGTFVRSVHAVLRTSPSSRSKRSSLVSPTYIIKSERAIVLSAPTPHNHYQYIWITSPMLPEHSLHHLLFERTKWTFIDYNNADYKIWSVYSLLKGVETLHSHKFAHLAIDPKAFYFDHEMKATDWKLGNLGCAKSMTSRHKGGGGDTVFPSHGPFTAPEIIQAKDNLQLEAADMWSLGCVIYTVATGGQLLFQDTDEVKRLAVFHDDMKQHLKSKIRQHVESQVFQNILERMLQVDPSERKHIKNVLDYWDSIYNMEE
ncbi:hypothetical protein MAM1_0074d04273 [Mucor ambiguus]|uniref:Protein kinase domain-containing protein n=1 Tax=Mucor ambiguus TaxID=91626 RepID=A0A0C9MS06_9FUNG|nr:hypothetical protein MAM1_0074d04273 [Mucor ambiguus]